jgi:hypothetical protein
VGMSMNHGGCVAVFCNTLLFERMVGLVGAALCFCVVGGLCMGDGMYVKGGVYVDGVNGNGSLPARA